MAEADIRWKQRLSHYDKALRKLEEAVLLSRARPLSELEEQGLIQVFEYTHELAWKTMKDFLENRGSANLFGSKDSTWAAFQSGLIQNGEAWMEMIRDRNLTSHTYNEETAAKIAAHMIDQYFDEFRLFREKMSSFSRED